MDDEKAFAKNLAHSSDPDIRDKTARMLGLWLAQNKAADELEYMRLWKALFFTVWHSDKVPVQQELAFRLARLLHELAGDHRRALLYISTLLATLQREWLNIDRYRLDKFMSLIRRFVGEALRYGEKEGWTSAWITGLTGVWARFLTSDTPAGIRFHLIDVLLEEIACVTPKIPTEALLGLLAPFWAHFKRTDDRIVYERALKELGNGLLKRLTARFGDKAAAAEEGAPEEEDEAADEEKLVGGSGGRANPLMVPLLDDRKARLAAAKSAFSKVNVAAVARAVFALACDAATQDGHRPTLYALHGSFAALATAAGHAKSSKDVYPPLKAPAATSVSEGAAAAPAAGGKRGRAASQEEEEEEEAVASRPAKKSKVSAAGGAGGVAAVAVPEKVKSKKVPLPPPSSDEDEEDDEEEAAAAAAAAALAKRAAAKGKGGSGKEAHAHVKFAAGTKAGAPGKSSGGKAPGKAPAAPAHRGKKGGK